MSIAFGVRPVPIERSTLRDAVDGEPFTDDDPSGDTKYACRQALARVITDDAMLSLAGVLCKACSEFAPPGSSFCVYGGTSVVAFGRAVGHTVPNMPKTTDVDIKFMISAPLTRSEKVTFVKVLAGHLKRDKAVEKLAQALQRAGATAPKGVAEAEIDEYVQARGVFTVGSVLFLTDPGVRVVTAMGGCEQHLAEVLFEVGQPWANRKVGGLPIRLPGYELLMHTKIVGECRGRTKLFQRNKLHMRAKRAAYLFEAMCLEAGGSDFETYFWTNTLGDAHTARKAELQPMFSKLLALEHWVGTRSAVELVLRDVATACIKEDKELELSPKVWEALYKLICRVKAGSETAMVTIPMTSTESYILKLHEGELYISKRITQFENSPMFQLMNVERLGSGAGVRYWCGRIWVDVTWIGGDILLRRPSGVNVLGQRYLSRVESGASVCYGVAQTKDDEYADVNAGSELLNVISVEVSFDGLKFQVRTNGKVDLCLPVIKYGNTYVVDDTPAPFETWYGKDAEKRPRPYELQFIDNGTEIELYVHTVVTLFEMPNVYVYQRYHSPPHVFCFRERKTNPSRLFVARMDGAHLYMYTDEEIMYQRGVQLLPARAGAMPNILTWLEKFSAIAFDMKKKKAPSQPKDNPSASKKTENTSGQAPQTP